MHVEAAKIPLTPEQQRIAQLELDLADAQSQLKDTQGALARLRLAYTRALEQLQLLRRRLFVAKAERADTCTEQLAFDTMFAQVHTLEKALQAAEPPNESGRPDQGTGKDKPTHKSKGRRNLEQAMLPERRVEILDPELEGRAERIGFEESSRLGYERGGMRRIVVARAVYKDPDVTQAPSTQASDPVPHIVRAPRPLELFRHGLLAPAMVAHVLCAKYMMGVPFYRLEQKFSLEGVSLDRSTMCRYAEDAGATFGAIVEAARKEAFETAFCLSTDATGVSIQLGPLADRDGRAPCRKAHFFVVLADRDHVFFEYQPKHTSAIVCEMFKGFSQYIQADAHAIYDALFRGTPPKGMPPDPERGPPPTEVGCWSHCRRNFWEAAVCKHALGVEGLCRIDAIFAADALLADLSPAQRKAQRDVHVRPLVDAFFHWVHLEYARPRERGLVATALGYARNQEQPLRRFLEDGRLRLENNSAERALRAIASARKSWLFFGSDDHAQAAANLFSLIASCKLHRIDPESYLADVIRVMPYWPRERYLELSPKYWVRTRARFNPTEMDKPLGHVTVPPPLPPEEQSPTS